MTGDRVKIFGLVVVQRRLGAHTPVRRVGITEEVIGDRIKYQLRIAHESLPV